MSVQEKFNGRIVLTLAQFLAKRDAGTLLDGYEYEISDYAPVVKINGTSITDEYGVSNIPIASTSVLGVLKVGAENYGLKLNSSNELVTQPADDSRIAAKANGNCPIVPNKLDKAVMEGLNPAASFTGWTDEKKAGARNTIGATTLVEYTGTETSYADNTLYYTTED